MNNLTLPQDRPLKGSDLLLLQNKFGCQVSDIQWVFNFSPNQWSKTTKKEANQNVAPIIEMAARFYDEQPEFWPIEEAPKLGDVREALGIDKARDIGIIFGKDPISGSRWLSGENAKLKGGEMGAGKHGTSPLVKSLAIIYHRLGKEGKKRDVTNMVEKVAKLRGIDDIWQVGSWVTYEESLIKKLRQIASDADEVLGKKKPGTKDWEKQPKKDVSAEEVKNAKSERKLCESFFEAYYTLNGNNSLNDDGLLKKAKKASIVAEAMSKKGSPQAKALKANSDNLQAEVEKLKKQQKTAVDKLEKQLGAPLVKKSS